jgi:formylglycine-generating enzyme required for sulfatase activity
MRRFWLDDYSISMHPVTNGDYLAYVEQTGAVAPDHWAARPPVGINASHPVCFVTWGEAMDYCRWLSDTTGRPYSLPSEAQWEKAARGGEYLDGDASGQVANPRPQRSYPHGEAVLLHSDANFDGLVGGTSPVGSYPASASPYGCFDLVGNVSEWCLDAYAADAYQDLPERNPIHQGDGKRVLRGGSWRSEADHARCSNRYFYASDRKNYGIGFRIVLLDT